MLASINARILSRALAVGVAYFVVASATILLTRFDGGVAQLWIATALLLAELSITERKHWWATATACAVASMLSTSLFGFGWQAALPAAAINLAEAMLGGVLLRRLLRQSGYLESLSGVAIFALTAGCIAPALSGFPGAAMATIVTGMGFWDNWRNWFAGHALGTLTFAPILALVLRGEIGRWANKATLRLKFEAAGLLIAMVAVCWFVFAMARVPLLFLPMLPLIVATFRLGRAGTAVSVVILTVIGGIMTARGVGPVNLIGGSIAERSQFFQIYLAVTVMIVLPVAAQLKHRKEIFQRLQESEARYKLITESATDMLLTFSTDGIVLYASPSSREIAGWEPEAIVGHKGAEFIDSRDLGRVLAAHYTALANPGTTYTTEYRGPTADRGIQWFEAHTRGIVDEYGRPSGVVCSLRDISERKSLEQRLSHAASTDGLTGLANRRAFDARLEESIAAARIGSSGGCAAIFDLDYFKRVNDLHGHEVGDMVLEEFAATALRTVRTGDLVARLGGEEFGIIFDAVDREKAAEICNRLRREVAASIVHTPAGATVSVTVSAGIAEFDGVTSRSELMRAADHALYTAKAAGRDRLRIAA